MVLRLRRICDHNVTFDKRSLQYQNYLITTEQKPFTVKPQFSKVRNEAKAEARTKQEKQDKVSDAKFITTHNPAKPNISEIIKNNLSIYHTDNDMKKLFPFNSLTSIYGKENNLKEILSPCLFLA